MMLTLKEGRKLQGSRLCVGLVLMWVAVVLSLTLIYILQYSCTVQAAVQWPECNETFHINPPAIHAKYLSYGLGSLWMTDIDNSKIWRIDPATGAVQASLDSNWGGGIAFDGQYLWKAAYSSPVIRCIRPTDGTTVREIPGVGTQQAGLAWDGTYLWIADRSTQRIYQLNPNTGAQVSSFNSPGPYPRGLVWWNGYLYHSDSHEDCIYQIEPSTGKVISKVATPMRSSVPMGLTTDGSHMWYSDWNEGIDRLIIGVSPDGRVIHSSPILMLAEMTYGITNTSDSPIENLQVYWAVPKLDAEHEIIRLSYDPVPDEYLYDEFDRKIAHFCFPSLAPSDMQQITLSVYERIWRVNYQVDPTQVAPLSAMPEGIRDLYLMDDDALEITHPDIVAAAQNAIDGETNPYRMAIKIHDYVAQHMVYEYPHDVPWNAVSVLHEGRGDCSRYTLLFIALGRSVGLPTRKANSVYYYENEDRASTHVWPEAYIPGYGWIPFDPTRDDTDPLRDRYVGCEPLGIVFPENGGTDDTYLGWWNLSWRASGMASLRDSTKSGLPPLRISDFSATTGNAPFSIKLAWTNPLAPDLNTVLVRRKIGQYPASRKDGTAIYLDTSAVPQERVVYEDTGLSPGIRYFYAVFAKSAAGIWRSKVEEGANAASTTPSSSETAAVLRIDEMGDVYADGAFYGQSFKTGSADVAEWVPVSEPVEPGDVLELDPDNPGHYRKSRGPCSDLVAGVVSTEPGFILGASPSTLDIGHVIDDSRPPTEDSALLALVGIVPVKVTNEGGLIEVGDLIVSSSTHGYAMKWDPVSGEVCGLIGKALEPLDSTTGTIKVLLMR